MMFYAVQVGDNYDWDYGSEDYDKALEIAQKEADDVDNAGMQIRIATIDVKWNICESVEIVREGWCGV